jgi:hypothetical protein
VIAYPWIRPRYHLYLHNMHKWTYKLWREQDDTMHVNGGVYINSVLLSSRQAFLKENDNIDCSGYPG